MKITFETADSVVVWDDVPEEKLSQLLNVRGCAMNFGINEHTASARVRRGWPVLLALATDDEEKQ
ncbi:hypothetical protein PU656_18725 [Klebsiella pneumoniae]|uniref:hypothetical protein n=1 Tax=Klebsiella pneumoniae TaxID=573 RepID=UPI0037509CB3